MFTYGKESPDHRQDGDRVPRIDWVPLDTGSRLFFTALRAGQVDHDDEALAKARRSMRSLIDYMGEDEFCRALIEDIADRIGAALGVSGKYARLPVLRDLCALFPDVDWTGLRDAVAEGRA